MTNPLRLWLVLQSFEGQLYRALVIARSAEDALAEWKADPLRPGDSVTTAARESTRSAYLIEGRLWTREALLAAGVGVLGVSRRPLPTFDEAFGPLPITRLAEPMAGSGRRGLR